MASFFNVGTNPFSTPVGQKIEQATDASLVTENWSLNMQICDMINESPDMARDAVKAIRKRLQQNAGKNNQVIMYTLIVLEACVKNCGKTFHVLVAHKDFIQELIKLIGPKNDPPLVVQEKVLTLIQIWADAFKNQPDLNGVIQMYNELKNKGIEFPPTDMENIAPIYTPQRSVPEASVASMVNQQTVSPQHAIMQTPLYPNQLTPENVSKLQAELDVVVSVNMSILSEMLNELKPGKESAEDYQLLNDLIAACKEMQTRIVDLIGRFTDDELTADLLRINDELNNIFLRHQRYEKSRVTTVTNKSPSAVLGAAIGIPTTEAIATKNLNTNTTSNANMAFATDASIAADTTETPRLLDFPDATNDKTTEQMLNDFPNMGISNATMRQAANKVDADEFDILAQSRTANGNANKSTDLLRSIPTLEATAGSAANSPFKCTHIKADNSVPSKENEIDEMAAWLVNSKELEGLEETVTSSEFDKFLEERAAAAENLPTINALNVSDKKQQHQQQQQQQQQQHLQADKTKAKKSEENLLMF